MKPSVWILDIETKPMVAYFWQRKEIYLAANQIKEDWSILAWSAKKLGEPEIEYRDLRAAKDYMDDKSILVPLRNILDKADIVITQNGKNFDSRKINARLITHGIRRPSAYEHWDTYLCISRVAAFTSNKLDHLSRDLGLSDMKSHHNKFPGMTLWTECLRGNQAAWRAMEKYNKQDVRATEALFNRIYEWAPKAFPSIHANKCETCGKMKKLRVKCPDCGLWETKQ